MEEALRKGQAAGRDAILDHLRIRPGMRILDLACGPGTLTIPMAKQLLGQGEVVGVDLAAGMLEAAWTAAGGRNLPLRFLRMDIENLHFPPATFDGACCGHGLHFMPNLGRTLREAHRVLKPKGRFAASIPSADGSDANPAQVAFGAALDARLGPSREWPELEATRAILADLDRLRGAALEAGFRFAETLRVATETTWDGAAHYVEVNANCLAHASRMEGMSDHVRQMVLAEAAGRLRETVGEGPFSAPATAHVLKAEA